MLGMSSQYLRIRPFQGFVPPVNLADKVNCVPYDVVSTEEAAAMAQGNEHSLLRVDRAEIDMPEGTDVHSDEVYAKALENFERLKAHGSLVRESAPCLYVYRQIMGDHSQTGIAVVCHVEDYDNDLIKKHEKTRRDKEDDRTRLIDTISANTGPIFLTYRDESQIDSLVAKVQEGEPHYDYTAPDGVQHTVWRVEGGGEFVKAFETVPHAYIADGHHRTASAARVARERGQKNPDHKGDELYNWFLCVLFPATQLNVLAYNRAVADLNGKAPAQLLDELRAAGFEVDENPSGPRPEGQRQIRMYVDGKWYGLSWEADPAADPVSGLDVSVLQDRILAPLLGVDDPRTSTRIEFIGGIRGTEALTGRVDSGSAGVAFSMYPTTVEQMMAIADAGQIMPPKSTWFEPKLRSGFFIHSLD